MVVTIIMAMTTASERVLGEDQEVSLAKDQFRNRSIKKVNDSQTSKNKSVNQYDQQMKFDEENEIKRYQSKEWSEVLSSMEASYYSEDEEEGSYDTEDVDEDEEGSSYSEEEE